MTGGAGVFMIAGTLEGPRYLADRTGRPGSMASGHAPGAAANLEA